MVNDALARVPEARGRAGKLLDDLRARGEAALYRLPSRRRDESADSDGIRPSSPSTSASRTRFTLDFYLQHEGYDGAEERARPRRPTQVIELVKASGLPRPRRRRISDRHEVAVRRQEVAEPRYIACNADESEPGTFKDHLLMERNPHLLIEGCAIGCYAIGAKVAYIYIRGEFFHVQHVLERAIDEAYARGFLGKNILGSGFDCDVYVAPRRRRLRGGRGDGAARVARRQARAAAQQAAVPGRRRPLRQADRGEQRRDAVQRAARSSRKGAEWFAALGPEKNGGPKLYCVSGHVKRPGVYEASMNVTLRELIEGYAGGVRDGRTLKAVIPGGSSVPILMPDQLDTQASFDAMQKAGSLLGSAAIVVLDDTTCMVWLAENLLHFYRHESCGKCTPCREGTDWLHKILQQHRARRRADARPRSAREHLGQHRRQDAVRLRRRRGHAGADDAEAFPARVRGAHQGRALHAAGDWRARQHPVGGALMSPHAVTPFLLAQIVLTLFVFVMLLSSAAAMVCVERKVAALLQQRRRPVSRRLAGAAPAARRRHQADVQGGAAAGARPIRSSSRSRRSSRRPPPSPRSPSCRSAPRRRSSACWTSRCGCRSPTSTSPMLVIFAIASMSVYGIVLAGWSSNSKVLAARRPALVGADDQLRAVVRPGARERAADRRTRCR